MLREDQALLQRSPRCADTVVAILTACGAGVEGSAATGRNRVPTAQPALVQQIVDMGFSRNRVEEALRRVRFVVPVSAPAEGTAEAYGAAHCVTRCVFLAVPIMYVEAPSKLVLLS